MDSISETRLAQVHPELSLRIHELSDALTGITIRITQGLRTWAEQDALYLQGRGTEGQIVTNAKGGYSAHNFGYAVDFVVMDGALPNWDSANSQWQDVLAEALKHGLAEGAQWRTFKDVPHLYLAELSADPDDEMRQILQDGGMQALWDSWNIPRWGT